MIKEIFRAGTWTDASGKTTTWTEQDIDEIIGDFDEKTGRTKAGRRVPLTTGHPEDNAPAFAWLGRLWRKGKSLYAEFVDAIPWVEKQIKQKTYREVSIALMGKSLRHVGLLGGVPPAVPNMDDFEFEGATVSGYKFSEGEYTEYDVEESEKDFTEKVINIIQKTFNLKKKGSDMPTLEEKLNDENVELKNKIGDLETKLSEANGKVSTLEEENKTLKDEKEKAETELSAANDKIQNFAKEKKELEYTNWCDRMISEKKLLPAKKEETMLMLKALEGQEEQEFKVGDETVKKAPQAAYMENIENGSDVLNTDRFSEGQSRNTGEGKLEKAIHDYQAEHKGVKYLEAAEIVKKIHPELEEAE